MPLNASFAILVPVLSFLCEDTLLISRRAFVTSVTTVTGTLSLARAADNRGAEVDVFSLVSGIRRVHSLARVDEHSRQLLRVGGCRTGYESE